MIKGLIHALDHLESSEVLHSDIKLLNIVRIHQLSTGLKTIKLIDMDAIAKLDGSGFMGAKFSSGVLPPEMFAVLDGEDVEKFTTYWGDHYSARTELWRKIEPRWARSGDAIVVKTWCVSVVACWFHLQHGNTDQACVYNRREVPLGSTKNIDHSRLPYTRVPATIAHDIWSLGVVTYQLLSGAPLFQVFGGTVLRSTGIDPTLTISMLTCRSIVMTT